MYTPDKDCLTTYDHIVIRDLMKLRQYQGKKLDFFIDIGANIGVVSLFVKALFPNVKIIAIEPHRETFECLRKNTYFVPHVYLENKALGKSKNCRMKNPGTRFMAQYTVDCDDGEIECINLKDIFEKYKIGLDSKYFIKSDCEGAEKHFIGDGFSELAIQNSEIFFMEAHFNSIRSPYIETSWATYNDWINEHFYSTHKIDYYKSSKKGGYGHYLLTRNDTPCHSSVGQDKWVLNTLNGKRDGYFIDIGASDGVTNNNTVTLERNFNWTGICVEPNPAYRAFQKLITERKCICENVCIYNESKEVDFLARGRRIEGCGIYDKDKSNDYIKRQVENRKHPTIKVPAITLMELLKKHNAPSVIDYISIDTEGSEWEILKDFDFTKYTFLTMTIENNYNERKKNQNNKVNRDRVRQLLSRHGYILKQSVPFGEDWFVHNSLEPTLCLWDGKFRKSIEKKYRITFCTTCMGRLYNLKETVPVNIKDNEDYENLEFLILDYNSQDGLGDWVKKNLSKEIESGRVTYYRTTEPTEFSMAHSRNIAFKLATGEIVNNLDADNYTRDYKMNTSVTESWASYINRLANEQQERVIFAKGRKGMHGRIGFYKDEFINLLGGYDENLLGYGHDDHDLVKRAWAIGFTMYWWGGQYYSRIKTTRQEKNTNLSRHWQITEDENKKKSDENIGKGIFKANQGQHWGKACLVRNFTEKIEI